MTTTARRRYVLFAHRLALETPTGIHRYAIELTRALANDADVDGRVDWTVCAPKEGRPPDWLPGRVTQARLRGPRRPTNLAWTIADRPRLERMIGRFDLLHVTAPVMPVPTARPLVVTVHDVLPLTHPEWYSGRERWLNGHAFRQAATARVITPSQTVAHEVQTVLGTPVERIAVIPEGVTPPPEVSAEQRAAVAAQYGVEPGRFLLFIGAVSPRKNLPVLLEALAGLAPTHRDLVLLAVGPHPPDAAPTIAAASQFGLGDRVRFPGFVPDADMHALLAGAVALVHPSSYEGFGLTPLEAMASGTPVISSDAGSLPEVVDDAGLLIDPTDPTAWGAAITQVVNDPQLQAELSRAGRARAAQFTWRAAAERTLAVYESAVAG